ncbi:MAG: heavy metal-binding domain-containing protein [Planctomycetota bacterium]
MIELFINLGIFGGLILLGVFAGGRTERRHLKRLDEREAAHKGFIVTQLKTFPGGSTGTLPPQVFMAEAVIASDYFKTFIAGIRKFFGGEMGTYQTLLERARRESLMKLIEQAKGAGYDTACNLRYETADIGGATQSKKGVVTVAIIATATAYCRKQASQ